MKGDNLPSLQKLIVLHLAGNEPQTMNETAKTISKHYKPTWVAFKSLEKKKLVRKAATKDYNGRKYPSYWLTDKGMIMALIEGTTSDKLLTQTKILYPEAKNIHCALEMIPNINPEVMKLIYSYAKAKGKLGFAEVATLSILQTTIPTRIETAKELKIILKKYPDQYNQLKKTTKEMIDQLNQLIND
jgi:hypothetical protein